MIVAIAAVLPAVSAVSTFLMNDSSHVALTVTKAYEIMPLPVCLAGK
jgi:hypothetical protein